MNKTEQLYQRYLKHPQISTDTRKITPGCLFFALKGEKFDANTFAQQAVDEGAAYAIVDNPDYATGYHFFLVDDVLTALQELARHHRRQLTIPVIGLTGTNGKTTTKELISAVLSQHFKTQFTQGNLNNHIGVPLTMLTIDASDEMAVIEMGANHQKEIGFLCTISQPTHGLITNVGKAHLEGFGGVEGVKKGKGELYDFLRAEEGSKAQTPIAIGAGSAGVEVGVAFINNDNSILKEMQNARGLTNVVYYGSGNGDDLVSGHIIDNSPYLTIKWINNRTGQSHTVKTQLTGAYNLDNILAAICIGVYFKLSDEEICKGIEGYQPKNNRSQIAQTATNTLICDYYNANPSSMAVAIENMDKLSAERKVMILGDMFELGDEAPTEHETVISKAMAIPVDERIFIGGEFVKAGSRMGLSGNAGTRLVDDNANKTGAVSFYKTAEEAIVALQARPIKNSTVLIKGSRGMALERLVNLF